MDRRHLLSGAAAVAAGSVLPWSAGWAQAGYPDRPVKLIVPWSAGGSTDLLARAVGQNMSEVLGKPVVIDNRPGAAGRLGIDAMTKSPADGYTAAVVELAHAIAPAIYQKMPYDIMNDTAAISVLGDSPLIFFVDAQKYQAGQYQKFLADAKKSSEPLSIATSGTGSISHLAAGLYAKEAGVQLQMVPYKGSAPALTDVAAGVLAGHFCTLASASAMLGAGKIVPLMITGSRRAPQLPNVPCASELGLTRMDFGQWWALVVPAKVPKPVVEALHKATATALSDKRVQSRISSLAINLGSRSPDETQAFIRAEAIKWSKVVASLGITPD
ncbi:MAG: tripartite tricarboxylate transporter substrate binding protein [Comamonadaceae bacterium]|nr:MAG: tripartite tricarboxylate transporter substrate binding protein [Comamonadaceae bacterium]